MNIAFKSGGRYHLLVDVGRPVSRVRKGLAHVVSIELGLELLGMRLSVFRE
jgi:hypothetical protein